MLRPAWEASVSCQDVTGLLLAWNRGDSAALEALMPIVYAELRRLARRALRRERKNHSLQTTALVHEVYLRLVDSSRVSWQDRAHFFAISAQLMRRVLVDAARTRLAAKRGGQALRVTLENDLLAVDERGVDLVALDEALERLSAISEREGRVVELRFFGGLSVEETAELLDVSPMTVMRDWKLAKTWLLRELSGSAP